MPDSPLITIELFGMARRRGGRAELRLPARDIGDALKRVGEQCPGLDGVLIDDRLSPHYLVSVNAGPFVTDLRAPLTHGDRVLLLSADAGG